MRPTAVVLCVALLAACGDGDDADSRATTPSSAVTPGAGGTSGVQAASSDDAQAAVRTRIDSIGDAVGRWRDAADVATALAAAEEAANLIVGPNGPGYGDRDGDGTVAGENDVGLLPGVDGTPEGIVVPLTGNRCVARDVLAGTIEDPAGAWAEMDDAIAAWTPGNNTMPSLASHPMRVVGWSTFTIAGDDLDEAHEYAGHAQLHVDVTRDALDC